LNLFEALHENALHDNELLRLNDEKGDIFDKARDVDFAFKTNELQRATDLSEFLNGKTFAQANVNTGDDGVSWVVAVIHMPISQNVLCSTSGFMLCLSRVFGVEYDGWGSVIQDSSATL
jgi:hypothetical protein